MFITLHYVTMCHPHEFWYEHDRRPDTQCSLRWCEASLIGTYSSQSAVYTAKDRVPAPGQHLNHNTYNSHLSYIV